MLYCLYNGNRTSSYLILTIIAHNCRMDAKLDKPLDANKPCLKPPTSDPVPMVAFEIHPVYLSVDRSSTGLALALSAALRLLRWSPRFSNGLFEQQA